MKRSLLFHILVLTLTVMLVISITACGGAKKEDAEVETKSEEKVEKSEEPKKSEEPAKKRTFAIIYPVIHPFFDPVSVSAEEYAKENGMEVIIKAPESGNVQQQVEILEDLIAMKVDGVAIGPTDPDALAPIIDKAVDKGIPVVTFDTDTPNCKRAGYIGTDNYKGGVHIANVIAKHLNSKGKILLLQGVPTQINLVERLTAIQDTLAKDFPDIEILDVQSGYADPAKSIDVLESMIQAHPDFDSVTGIGACGGLAAISVWKAKGWSSKDKKIITFDNTPENMQALREGVMTAIVSQNQHTWGVKILDGLNALCDGKTISEFEDTGTIEITLENIDTYQN